MTRTEDRLADALGASAELVRPASLRPLVPPAIERTRPGGRVWLRAVAAAAAVLVVVGGTAAIRNWTPGGSGRSALAEPEYRLEVDIDGDIVVRSTATGQITDRLRAAKGATELTGTVVTGASRAPMFATAIAADGGLTAIRTFGLSKTGHIDDLRLAGAVPKLIDVALALSPDGTRIAIAGVPQRGTSAGQVRIQVLDLRTGQQSVWAGGTTRHHRYQLMIPSLSWSSSGRSLIYLANWCLPGGTGLFDGDCLGPAGKGPTGGQYVKELQVYRQQHLLPGSEIGGKSKEIFGQASRPRAIQVIVDPADANAVFLMEQSGSRDLIYRDNIHGGVGTVRVFRSKAEPTLAQETTASLYADPSGRYLLVNVNRGQFYGWVHAGQFHPLDARKVDWQSGAW